MIKPIAIVAGMFIAGIAFPAAAANHQPTLTVYTYSSFVS